jgi:hypothetical protein
MLRVMRLCCFFMMMRRVQVMCVRQVSMMGRFLVVSSLMMFGSFHVVLCCVFVVLSRLFMMFVNFEGHGGNPFYFLLPIVDLSATSPSVD